MIRIAANATSVTYAVTGTQTIFAFPFDYLRKSFVKATLDDVAFTYGLDFTVNEKEITFTKAPSGTLRIYRETSTDRLVGWIEGSVLKATDMTVQQVQTIHVLEETVNEVYRTSLTKGSDGQWDAKGKRIENVGNPLNDQDVVTKLYLSAYMSIGEGVDPDSIKKILEGVTINADAIEALHTQLEAAAKTIPSKTSQLTNDDYVVKDASYVHTDNNYTSENKNKLEGLKELQRIEFTTDSPYWSGNTFTQAVNANNVLVALFKTNSAGNYVADGTTEAYVDANSNLVINASGPFKGYAIVSGTVSYGNLYELFALLLNEEVAHTYTLDEIIGQAYKEPVYPDKDQLAKSMTDFTNNMNSISTQVTTALQSANVAKAECEDYYNMMNTRWSNVDPSTFATKTELESAQMTNASTYARQEQLAAYLPKANIVSVSALPTTPDANTWYFIQESST